MPLPEFALERFFARHEFSVPHLLCASDCESISVGELLALAPAAREALDALRLGYSASPGSPELRAAIAMSSLADAALRLIWTPRRVKRARPTNCVAQVSGTRPQVGRGFLREIGRQSATHVPWGHLEARNMGRVG